MTGGLTTDLATWARDLQWTDLPTEVQQATICRLVDSLGVMLAGSVTEAGQVMERYARSVGGITESTLMNSAHRLPAELAALVHGTWAHVHDFDDTEPQTVIHPTSPVVAAALSVGEAESATPEQILTAMAVGIEVMCRIGMPAGRRFHHRGFHATAIAAPIATALTAGLLKRSSVTTMVHSMGLAGSMSGGLLAFLADGTWAKRLHPGWGAHGGVTAAKLAAQGFTGPAQVLEDRHGVYAAFLHGEEIDPSLVTADLGHRWVSVPLHVKRYPCAHVIHPFLDAALSFTTPVDQIEKVVLRLPAWQVPIVCEPWDTKIRPSTEYQARTSLPFSVASALVDSQVGIDTYREDLLNRVAVADLLARVTYEIDPDLADFEVAVEITTTDGQIISARPPLQEPPLRATVRTKLADTAGRVCAPEVLAQLSAALNAEICDPVALALATVTAHSAADAPHSTHSHHEDT